MGTPGLEVICFRGRYYTRLHHRNGYVEELGGMIISSIPTDPEKYKKWLKSKRDYYAAKERKLEEHVYEIRNGPEPNYSEFCSFASLPSAFARLGMSCYVAWSTFIINLDREVLTINGSMHYKLDNIPRKDDLWVLALSDSIYAHRPTISLERCPEEHMASLALELPEPNEKIGYAFRLVTPKTDFKEPRMAFLTKLMAQTIDEYKDEVESFGLGWSPDSFPFRELTFALVSMAADQVEFHSFSDTRCQPTSHCFKVSGCETQHRKSPGWVDAKNTGGKGTLLEFGAMSHRPGEPPGASPTETMYWLQDVLVSLVLVVDGEAITKAVTWGLEQSRTNFQVVVMSLFDVAFAEVSYDGDQKPFVTASKAMELSPLRPEACVSTHPRERPELKDGMKSKSHPGDLIFRWSGMSSERRLRTHFPGFAALVNFFDTAYNRLTPPGSAGNLPQEMCDRILDFVDYET